MGKLMEVAAAAALIAGGAGAATAQDWNGAEQIARGDYASAEQVIAAQQRMFPRDVDLTLNLATVYAMTGRTTDAQRLYQVAAALPNEKLDMPGRRIAWSRDVAAMGLKRLSPAMIAAR